MHSQQLNGHHSSTMSNTNTQTEKTEPPTPSTPILLSSSTSETRLHQMVKLVDDEDIELYSLRLLLDHVRGPRSYEDLRTVNGVQHETFQEAAIARNLVKKDEVWIECMKEIIDYVSSVEFCCKLMEDFDITETPSVEALPVHLPKEQKDANRRNRTTNTNDNEH